METKKEIEKEELTKICTRKCEDCGKELSIFCNEFANIMSVRCPDCYDKFVVMNVFVKNNMTDLIPIAKKIKEIELKRKDVIPPSPLHKEIEDRIIKDIQETDCFVKFDLLGLWVLRSVVLDYFEKGSQSKEKEIIFKLTAQKKNYSEALEKAVKDKQEEMLDDEIKFLKEELLDEEGYGTAMDILVKKRLTELEGRLQKLKGDKE